MEDYVKTGEDKNYEYYRNDSEVLSGDGENMPYEDVLNKKNEFNVKIGDNVIVIKKPTLHKIMIMSDSEPEEQILFSLYKTVAHANKNELDSLRNSKPVPFPNTNLPDPLSGQTVVNNNVNAIPSANDNVINIPTNEPINEPTNEGSDNEDINFKKAANANTNANNNLVIVGLPPLAVKTKWFYLLLALVGLGYDILFVGSLLSDSIGFMFNTFCVGLFGVFLIFTGIYGFLKVNNRIYDDSHLKLFTLICILLGILGVVLIILSSTTKGLLIPSIILAILAAAFAILCIIWTSQLKKVQETNKVKQMELLVD